MGTFGGHILPGVAFIIYGLRWAYCSMCRYFLCRRDLALGHGRSGRFRSSLTFPVSWCPGIPLEAAFLLFATVIIMAAEISAINSRGVLEVGQHLAMYFFYGVAASTLILRHYRYQMLPDVEYVCFALSFLVDTFLMQRHIMGKSMLEVQAHQNNMLVMMAAVLAVVLEMKYRHNAILPVIRAYCFSLNGSWLVMEDFMLWSPSYKWPNEDHKWVMLATISFGAHIAGNLLVMLLISGVALMRVKSLSPSQVSLYLDREGLGQEEEIHRKVTDINFEQSEGLLANYGDDV